MTDPDPRISNEQPDQTPTEHQDESQAKPRQRAREDTAAILNMEPEAIAIDALRTDIIDGTPTDQTHVAAVIASAFQHLDVAQWLIPTVSDREPVLAANMRIWVKHAFATGGVVNLTIDRQAVAVWFTNSTGPDDGTGAGSTPRDYDRQLHLACGPYAQRFRLLDQAFADNHPRREPHHHLAFMAVTPDQQRRGAGSALLRHHLRAFPEVACYLEASCPESRELYLRHGFQDLGKPFVLPGGPPMWPMWRDA